MSCSPTSSDNGASKTRRPAAAGKRHNMSVCQVTGCGVAVVESQARRLKTCEPHRRAVTVDMDGVPSRFCQQCTLIHPLNHFDGAKRGCRRRLELRNSRRQQKTAARRNPSSEPGTPSSSCSENYTPMKPESSSPSQSSSACTDSPKPESPRSPSPPHSPTNSATPTLFPSHQYSAGVDANVITYACDECPPWAGHPGYFSSGPSAAIDQTPGVSGTISPEDFENAISSMQWAQSREAEKIGRPMRMSITGEFGSLSPDDLLTFLKLPNLPDEPLLEDGNDGDDSWLVIAWP